jgi:pyruvate,water dikinase
MATVVPLGHLVDTPWYPGSEGALGRAPTLVEGFSTFRAEDEGRFWFLDFHWPRGLTPLATLWNEDGYAWGTQLAAESMPLPPGRGIAQRIAGTHTYASPIPVTEPGQFAERAGRFTAYLPNFLADFGATWQRRRDEIDREWQHLRAVDLQRADRPGLAAMLHRARAFHRRAFEIHFEMMYPLLATYLGFSGMCGRLGISSAEVGRFVQGYDTRIMAADRGLWRLTDAARAAGLAPTFAATSAGDLAATLDRAGGLAAAWMTQFRDYLQDFGWRTEGSADVALPSWVEDPTPALGMIKSFLTQERHDFDAAHQASVEDREGAIDAARSRLTRREQHAFDEGLTAVQSANFMWWQDDHNVCIDLRVALPMRWAALAVAERVGADEHDDTLFLFWHELIALTSGQTRYADLAALVRARRAFFDHWHDRRASMPKVLGTIPSQVEDPILVEVFGLTEHYLEATTSTTSARDLRGQGTTLTGVPSGRGTARGVARVLTDADLLHLVRPGEILVCESTSPNWTPVFATIAGCVCDGGGTLSHAAIVGREYGVPTVSACAVATTLIHDGDVVEVDGDRGVVRIIRRAGSAAP